MSSTGREAVVSGRALTRSFTEGGLDVHAVRSVDIAIYPGEFVGLAGPSGCGKSTLLNVLGLVDSLSGGRLFFEGRDVSDCSEREAREIRRSRIGYVFQSFNLLSTLTIQENVMVPLMLGGYDQPRARARALELLERVALIHRADSLPFRVSGGEAQRAALCRAVAHSPALILADEPTGNLDSASGERVLGVLEDIVKSGTPVLMATHSEEAMERCSRVLKMRDGVIVDG